jgi:hypothetical protein
LVLASQIRQRRPGVEVFSLRGGVKSI